MSNLVHPGDIDRLFRWPVGQALKLARLGKLPHVVLPDDSVRFDAAEVAALVRVVPAGARKTAVTLPAGAEVANG